MRWSMDVLYGRLPEMYVRNDHGIDLVKIAGKPHCKSKITEAGVPQLFPRFEND
jgi:hypothetical protein